MSLGAIYPKMLTRLVGEGHLQAKDPFCKIHKTAVCGASSPSLQPGTHHSSNPTIRQFVDTSSPAYWGKAKTSWRNRVPDGALSCRSLGLEQSTKLPFVGFNSSEQRLYRLDLNQLQTAVWSFLHEPSESSRTLFTAASIVCYHPHSPGANMPTLKISFDYSRRASARRCDRALGQTKLRWRSCGPR
jgi:hypothetical protein